MRKLIVIIMVDILSIRLFQTKYDVALVTTKSYGSFLRKITQ